MKLIAAQLHQAGDIWPYGEVFLKETSSCDRLEPFAEKVLPVR